jgi:hypothetical protein
MKPIFFANIAIILCIYSINVANCFFNITANDLLGTEFLEHELTDKQLGIQKYLAWLTILQDGDREQENGRSFDEATRFGWKGWESVYYTDQKYLNSVRYPLAFVGYTFSILAYKTPSYRELAAKVLDNCIRRLIERHQYMYIEDYWKKQKTFPDPIAHENIMYSAHLALLIALYESISLDFKYTNRGWSFVWSNDSEPIHYDAEKLMRAINAQVNADSTGGVACEPNSIFIICNNFQRLAFILYDRIHNTNHSSTNHKWEKWMVKHGRAPSSDYRYLRIIYYKPAHAFIPIYGTSGNDAWALTYMGWIADKQFIIDGYEKLTVNKNWIKVSADMEYLDGGLFGNMSELNTWLASSMYPMLDRQYASAYLNSSHTHFPNRTRNVFNWFEKRFGRFVSTSDKTKEQCNNVYAYETQDPQYQIWSTANLLMSMISDPNSFANVFIDSFFLKHSSEPQLINIDYPRLHVQSAFYNKSMNKLAFRLKADCWSDVMNTSFIIKNEYTLKRVTLTIDDLIIDVTKHAKLDAKNAIIKFENINITHKSSNKFDVYF